MISPTTSFTIRDRFFGRPVFTCELGGYFFADAPPGERLAKAVQRAVEAGASLRGADLQGANLRGMDLRGMDLREVDLGRAILAHAKYSVEFGDVLDLVHALGDPPRVVFPRGAAIEDPPDPPRFVDRSQPRDE